MRHSLHDFQGGYATSVPSPLMKTNELLVATNCHWENKLIKRRGYLTQTSQFAGRVVVGMFRTAISGTFEMILAVSDEVAGLEFFCGDDDTYTKIGSYTGPHAQRVEFAQLGQFIGITTGVDWPLLIRYVNDQYTLDFMESDDIRIRASQEWYVGQITYENQEETFSPVVNLDTSFELIALQTGSGFIISSDRLFNQVTFSDLSRSQVPGTFTYAYSNNDTWVPFIPTEEPDWIEGGTGTLAFDLPHEDGQLLWNVSDDPSRSTVHQRYAIKVTREGNTDALWSGGIEVSLTQYLRVVMGFTYGTDIVSHNSRFQIASGNVVNFSPVNSVRDWRSDEIEYFQDGGVGIQKMVSFPNALIVMKEDAIYALSGNSYQTYQKRMVTKEGTIAPRSVVVMDQEVYYLSRDGIRGWNGTQSVILTKHIRNDIPFDRNACAMNYDRHYWISFPLTGHAIRFDPDTAYRRENGDAHVSCFKYTNYRFNQLIYASANADSGYVYGSSVTDGLCRLDVGTTDNGQPITSHMQTLFFSYNQAGSDKRLGRIKVELIPSGVYVFSVLADHGERAIAIPIDSGSGPYPYVEEVSLPYDMDGKNVSFSISHAGSGKAEINGIHIEQFRRQY